MFEANIRRDASSKMHPDFRTDYFPSASIGWRVSEEDFMSNMTWIDNLKIRASIGEVGNINTFLASNSASDRFYPYRRLLSNYNYPIGGEIQVGVANNQESNPQLAWEVIETRDFWG